MSAIPVGRAGVLTRPQLRTRAQVKARANVAARTFLFMTVAAGSYVAATLSGQVLLEQARRQSLSSQARTTEARQAESVLRHQVDELSSLASIAAWARANGFSAPDAQRTTSD